MRIHLLDMGQKRFGDCIVITEGEKIIMIDGGHPGDSASILNQLAKVLKKQPPYKINLLVVTHCHSDHIGCLPELVSLGHLIPANALLADEKMGFGLGQNDNSDSIAAMSVAGKAMFVAAQEEDHSGMPDAEIQQFLFDAAKLVDQYTGMINQLTKNRCKVQMFPGKNWDWVKPFETKFEDFGLRILGPTIDHLVICAASIAKLTAAHATTPADGGDSVAQWVNEYKKIVQKGVVDAADPEADMPGIGAAKNNQSIVLSVDDGKWKALLAGDMQFAKAEVPALGPIMNQLFKDVAKAGPYDFIKLTHHSSYNGINEAILNEWLKNTHFFAHTGGLKDPTHPDTGALTLLKKNQNKLSYARTDRNGLITVSKKGTTVAMETEKSGLNNFTPNTAADVQPPAPVTNPVQGIQASTQAATVLPAPQVAEPILVERPVATEKDVVKIIAVIPNQSGKVTIIVDIAEKKNDDPKLEKLEVADKNYLLQSNRLSGLLFLTCSAGLYQNIGKQETDAILADLRSIAGSKVLDIPLTVKTEQAAAYVVAAMKGIDFKGVVIIGGYDVVPPHCLKAIDTNLSNQLMKAGKEDFDADDFIVWSDAIYGDKDGDFFAELPVSRIPDAKDAELIRACLNAPLYSVGERYGVRNVKRPFADQCYNLIPGASSLEVSELFNSQSPLPAAKQSAIYYMLHGSESDGTKFWGEFNNGGYPEAVELRQLPHAVSGTTIFSGCCWGALTVNIPAYRYARGESFRPRLIGESIALAYLKAGALAFVGCTGSHYSPVNPPLDNYGKPMHDLFWKGIAMGFPPASALWKAKIQYLKDMPHGLTDPIGIAAELKILRQYTCLGLGW